MTITQPCPSTAPVYLKRQHGRAADFVIYHLGLGCSVWMVPGTYSDEAQAPYRSTILAADRSGLLAAAREQAKAEIIQRYQKSRSVAVRMARARASANDISR